MTEGPAATTRQRAPIALQIVGLMLAGMLASQLVTIAIVLFMPSTPHRAFPAGEIAAALAHDAPGARGHLIVSLTAAPPAPPAERVHFDQVAAAHLATLMGVPMSRVHFYYVHDSNWLEAVKDIWRRQNHRPPPMPPGSAAQAAQGGFVTIPNMPFPVPALWLTDPDYPFAGDFVAAALRPSGQWALVKPASGLAQDEWALRILVWLAGGALVIAPAGYFFARRITAPLAHFAQAARRLGSDPRSAPVRLDGPAEVGLAADAFNDMQSRIQRYISDRTAMFTAISHDLRTPLARIRFKLERTPEPVAHSIARDVDQMEKMISSVLTFMREGQSSGPRQRIDLQSLLEYVTDETVTGGGDAEVQDGPVLTVSGDVEALKRLFANLIGNAVAYGVCAHVSMRREGDDAVVEILDEGPGLPEGELERVFEPFYRADHARNLDAGGVGLGLAITRSIALEHGGQVRLETAPTGLRAVVRLPLDPAFSRSDKAPGRGHVDADSDSVAGPG